MAKADLTAQRLRELLHYDPETGAFVRLVARGRMRIGDGAGTINRLGYLQISIDGATYLAHRLAWLHAHGEWPNGFIDHINGVRANNALANLRVASPSANSQNRQRADTDSVSGILGVRFKKGGWESAITVGGKAVYLGRYGTSDEASAAYLSAKRLLHEGNTL